MKAKRNTSAAQIWEKYFSYATPEEEEEREDPFGLHGEYFNYYIKLTGTSLVGANALECVCCGRAVEVKEGRLKQSYLWLGINKDTDQLECFGLMCPKCSKKFLFPVKPYATYEEEKFLVDYYLNILAKKV